VLIALEPERAQPPVLGQIELVELHGPHAAGAERPEGEDEKDEAAHSLCRNMPPGRQ
jgi:hypothetical protein